MASLLRCARYVVALGLAAPLALQAQHRSVATVSLSVRVLPVSVIAVDGRPSTAREGFSLAFTQPLALTNNDGQAEVGAVIAPSMTPGSGGETVSVRCGLDALRCVMPIGALHGFPVTVLVRGMSDADQAAALADPSTLAGRLRFVVTTAQAP